MSKQLWTSSQVEYLMLNAVNTPVIDLANYLNKSINSVRSKIQRLNIPKLDEVAIEKLKRIEVSKQAKAIKLLTPKEPTVEAIVEHSFTEIAVTLGVHRETVIRTYNSAISKIAAYLKDNPDVADEWVSQMMNDEQYYLWDFE